MSQLAWFGLIAYLVRDALRQQELAIHSQEALGVSSRVETRLLDEELETRAFVLTGDRFFVERLEHTTAAIEADLRELERLTGNRSPEVAKLRSGAMQVLAFHTANASAIERGPQGEVVARMKAGKGLALMTSFRRDVATFAALEHTRAQSRALDSHHAYRKLMLSSGAGLVVNLGLGLGLVFAFGSMTKKRLRLLTENIQRFRRDEPLLNPIGEGTDEIHDLDVVFREMASAVRASQRSLEEQAERLRRIAEIQTEITGTEGGPEALLAVVALNLRSLTGAEAAVIELREGNVLVCRAVSGEAFQKVGERRVLADEVLDKLDSVVFVDCVEQDSPFISRQQCSSSGFRSAALIPFPHQNRMAGLLTILARHPSAFTEHDLGALGLVGQFFGVVLFQNIRFQQKQLLLDESTVLLRESRDMFEYYMNNNPSAAWMKDEHGHFLWVNRGFERMFNLDFEEIVGLRADEVPGSLPDVLQIEDEQVLGGHDAIELLGRSPTGAEQRYWLTMKFPIEIRGRRFLGAIAMDVTHEKVAQEEARDLAAKLEQRVAERTAQLEAVNRELEAFSYSVSHDLRAPLRAVDGFARMLAEDYGPILDSEGRRFVDVIRSESQRMATLIDDLLEYSRVSRQEAREEPIDVGKLATEIFSSLTKANDRVGFHVQIDTPSTATGDKAMIRQVLVNLLGNALKFTRNSTEPLIEVGGRARDANENIYWVRDNGAGFDMRYAGKLFGVFQRLHRSDEFPGTGVGLAIVQRVIQRHGGRVWAEAEEGKGATFFFTLPIFGSQRGES